MCLPTQDIEHALSSVYLPYNLVLTPRNTLKKLRFIKLQKKANPIDHTKQYLNKRLYEKNNRRPYYSKVYWTETRRLSCRRCQSY